jgi:hypothetical protein
LELTRDHVAAAWACGCAFFPATEAQVQRLTMQRRIFRVDGKPFLATRDGAYYETQATLLRLIETAMQSIPQAAAVEVLVPSPEPVASSPDEGAPAGSQAGIPVTAPMQKQGRPRTTKAKLPESVSPRAKVSPLVIDTPAAQLGAEPPMAPAQAAIPEASRSTMATEVSGGEAAVALVEGAGTRSRTRSLHRRAGQPKTPRWVTAGKERRGRLK